MSAAVPRDEMLAYVRRQLVGDIDDGPDEFPEIEYPPYKHFIMGILRPQSSGMDPALASEGGESEGGGGSEDGDEHAAAVSSAYEYNPSSVGLTCFLQGDSPNLEVSLQAAVYEGDPDEGNPWKRRVLSTFSDDPEKLILIPGTGGDKPNEAKVPVLEGKAELFGRWLREGDGWVVTVVLINSEKDAEASWRKSKSRPGLLRFLRPERCLYQVGLQLKPVDGAFMETKGRKASSWDDEEDELKLMYRGRAVFAVGHGAGADWSATGDSAEMIKTDFTPTGRVRDVTFDIELDDGEILNWQVLADSEAERGEICDRLVSFVELYSAWLEVQKEHSLPDDRKLREAAERIFRRIEYAEERMKNGVECLRANPDVFKAFQLANEAILMQRIHQRQEYAGEKRDAGSRKESPGDYFDPELRLKNDPLAWRPFQLAFFLLSIPSLVDPGDDEHELVDLLWFPTGGGKTEAYLGLTAFEIFRRRFMDGAAGGGTAVLKRYTYRVLTFQQFERASTLISACDLIRKREDMEGGRITVGLWVGMGITPNSTIVLDDPQSPYFFRNLSKGKNPYQIRQCAWCGTDLMTGKKDIEAGLYGGFSTNPSFQVFCPDSKCEFSREEGGLPVKIIDQQIYDEPPSLVIATIDKFAQLPWNERTGTILGVGQNCLPPSLFIQDELHLINGPLGTVAGLYEAAMEVIIERCWDRMRGHKYRPKIIGATATIRRSNEQAKALYGRDVRIFPPPGVSADDSFFMRETAEKPGRLYLGIMGQGFNPMSSLIHTLAAVSLAPSGKMFDKSPIQKDGYWTQVAYHNSRRELGRTETVLADDVPKRMQVVTDRDGGPYRASADGRMNVEQLSGMTQSEEIPGILARLDVPCTDKNSLDYLVCTSILSVGVDKPRLGLMLMNGQPKTTAEYIQSTSRVGRGDTPGLVITLLSWTKPRDRSHYEDFKGYHESIYRWVEPMSVTPYAHPARHRSLPAALVAAVRHGVPWSHDMDARNFDAGNEELMKVLELLNARLCSAAPADAWEETRFHLKKLVEQWNDEAGPASKLHYNGRRRDRACKYLLKDFGSDGPGLWEALNSMRLVDVESLLRVTGDT